MIEKSLHANILSAVLSDPTDRNFISTVRSYFDGIKEPNKDEECTKNILKNIIVHNITERDEVLWNIASEDYSEKVVSNILHDIKYSQVYKSSLLSKLNMNKAVSKFIPYRDEMIKYLEIMDRDGGNRKGEDALKSLLELSNAIHKTAQDFALGNTVSNVLVLSPRARETDLSSYINLAKMMRVSTKNKVKTLPVMDNMWGGGAIPGSLYLCPGISGKGKSLFMQNLCLYACKNNKASDFVVEPGMSPCVVMFSYEMDFRQCLERTLSWLGIQFKTITEKESDVEYAERLKSMMMEGFKKFNFELDIVYIAQNTDDGEALPDAGTIEAEIESLKNNLGLQPVFIAIDYLDRMDLRNKKLKVMGESGADGAVKTRLKAREVRDVGKRKQVVMLSATQLDADAMTKCDRIEPYQKTFDICLEFGMGNVSGSKNLRAEVEDVIMVHKFDIEVKSPDSDQKHKVSFIAVKQEKDRDNKASYKLSTRDKENFHQYQNYTQLLKNSSRRDMLKLTTKVHAVIPMEGFRMSDVDYAMSIRMFFPSENSDFVSLNSLVQQTFNSVSDDELNDRMEEMFEMEFLPTDEVEELMQVTGN